MLSVAVLIKQVPDHEAIIQVPAEDRLDIEERYLCSFFDEVAVEAALDILKAHPQTEVTALSAGGKRASEALRRSVAMGIDRVMQLGDESLERADSLTVAQVLAAKLRELGPQLVLCGKQAGDDDQAAVGSMLAELLGMPFIGAAVSLQVDPVSGSARVGRKLEGAVWTLQAKLPLVVAADKGLAEPHIPVVTRVMKAMKARIDNIPLADLDTPVSPEGGHLRRIRYLAPPTRPPVTMLKADQPGDLSELVRRLFEAGVLS